MTADIFTKLPPRDKNQGLQDNLTIMTLNSIESKRSVVVSNSAFPDITLRA